MPLGFASFLLGLLLDLRSTSRLATIITNIEKHLQWIQFALKHVHNVQRVRVVLLRPERTWMGGDKIEKCLP